MNSSLNVAFEDMKFLLRPMVSAKGIGMPVYSTDNYEFRIEETEILVKALSELLLSCYTR